jgi:integrase
MQLLWLTAQRRQKVATMKWSDVDDGGVWTVASDAREKGTIGSVALPKMALDIIRQQPRFVDNEYVFPGRGNTCFSQFSRAKAQFDAKLPNVAPWVVHDLRRTARSLMARAHVSSEIAERIMGHALPGVEGIYNRFAYLNEKAHALAALAKLIEDIVNGSPSKVIPIRRRRGHA